MTLSYEASASIRAPIEPAWLRLSDVLRWNGWTPTITQVEALDGPELKPGHRFRVTQPKLRPAVWSVTSLESPYRFSWETRLPGVVMLADHILERRAPGDTSLLLRFSFAGMLGPLVGRMNRKLVQSYLDTEAACLRRCVEADVAALGAE